jgi:hypothetical protein
MPRPDTFRQSPWFSRETSAQDLTGHQFGTLPALNDGYEVPAVFDASESAFELQKDTAQGRTARACSQRPTPSSPSSYRTLRHPKAASGSMCPPLLVAHDVSGRLKKVSKRTGAQSA